MRETTGDAPPWAIRKGLPAGSSVANENGSAHMAGGIVRAVHINDVAGRAVHRVGIAGSRQAKETAPLSAHDLRVDAMSAGMIRVDGLVQIVRFVAVRQVEKEGGVLEGAGAPGWGWASRLAREH